MVFWSCCNICSMRTFPEKSWWSLQGEGGCSGTRPGRMGTRNSAGVPHQREAQGNYSWGEDFHHQLRDGDLFQIMQLPSLTSLSRWRKLLATACATWRGGAGTTPTFSLQRGRPYLLLTGWQRLTTSRYWRCFWCCFVFALHTHNFFAQTNKHIWS